MYLLEEGVYDNLAITQRGVGDASPIDPLDKQAAVPFFQDDGTTRVKRFPTIKCKNWLSGSAFRAVRDAYLIAGRDFSAAEVSMDEVSARSCLTESCAYASSPSPKIR